VIKRSQKEIADKLDSVQLGQALIDALQASPCQEIEIEPKRETMPVRANPCIDLSDQTDADN
jgi:hypothetical protein